ncbi:hypothetical protein [Ralstonia solanacearum]|uniref:hypothetical protein n=1 Tax=Ralstonia solanacearum TaxID=305 RepID=UPI0011C4331E|nr:hypothetical protein [Ralstonia solanacearum]
MKSEQVLIDAIERVLLKRLDALNRPQLVAALSIPATALGREYKKGLRAEQRKQRRTTGARAARADMLPESAQNSAQNLADAHE